jgi:biotin carboxyl carrier protein
MFEVEVDRRRFRVTVAEMRSKEESRSERRHARRATDHSGNVVLSPMHGTVVALRRSVGEHVERGDTLLVVEAMKMENDIPAPRPGTVAAIDVAVGQTVEAGQRLASLE